MDLRDTRFMERAIALAEKGWGRVHPNPLVGAVIAQGDETVGSGWHAEWGGPHAEVVAIQEAGDRARGGDLFVTLEPCMHHGKTPPCTDAIVRAGIRRVVFAATDPTVAGGGAGRLRAAGIDVVEGVCRDQARALNRAFHHIHEHGPPFLALKLAISLDGRISRTRAAPTPLSGEHARAEVLRLRAGFDAILVGGGTVRADDPQLTARGEIVPRLPPVRVVFDSRASLPLEKRMVTDRKAPVWVVVAEDAEEQRLAALRSAGVRTFRVPRGRTGVDIPAALAALREAGIGTILCEGGARLAAALLEADRVDRMYFFVAPVWLGESAVPAFALGALPAGGWQVTAAGLCGRDARLVFDRLRDSPAAWSEATCSPA